MTLDVRHDLAKEERVAIAVLGFGSLITLGIGYAMLLYENRTIGFIVVSVSGLILLAVLIINSMYYTKPESYQRLLLLFNPSAALREGQIASSADDSPPQYKKAWAKAFNRRTHSDSIGTEGVLPTLVDIDLERHLGGRVAGPENGKGKKLRRSMIQGRPAQEVCVLGALTQDQQVGDGNCPPPFEVAILELSAKELAMVHEKLPQSSFTSNNDTIELGERFPTVLGKPSDVFSIEEEFRRSGSEASETRTSAHEKTCLAIEGEFEVAEVDSPQLSSAVAEVHSPHLSPAVAEVHSPQLSSTVAEVHSPQLSPAVAEVHSPQLSSAVAEVHSPQLSSAVAEVHSPQLSSTVVEVHSH